MGCDDLCKFGTEQTGDSFGWTGYLLLGGTEKRFVVHGRYSSLNEALAEGIAEIRKYISGRLENMTGGPYEHAMSFADQLKELA